MIFLLRDTGLINDWLLRLGLAREPLTILYTPSAVMLGLVYGFLPFMILPIYASLEKLDSSLLEAAEVLGARPSARFWRVTLPLSMPGVVAGSLLVFIPALGSFLTPDLLGGAKQMMIGNLVQNQFSAARNWPFGSAASFIVMALVLVAVLIYLRIQGRESAGTVAMNRRAPGWLLVVGGVVYAFLHLPLLVLIVFSFNDSKFSVEWEGFTFRWYHRLLERPEILRGLKLSLIVGVTATLIATVLGTLLALALGRHRFPGRRGIRGLSLPPYRYPRDRGRDLAADPLRSASPPAGLHHHHHRPRGVLYQLCRRGGAGAASGDGPASRGSGYDPRRR